MKRCFLFILLISPLLAKSQNNCGYQIDTNSIILNKNLDSFIYALQMDTFTIAPSVDFIPDFINFQLQCLAGEFGIVNPKQEFRCCCTSPKSLPTRQLSFLAFSKNTLVLIYHMGEGVVASSRILMIRHNNSNIIDLWTGYYWDNPKSILLVAEYLQEYKSDIRSLKTHRLDF